jgi:SAM-dependent MidA family methyltransferase
MYGANAERSTPKTERRITDSVIRSLDVRRWAFDVFWLNSELVRFMRETIRAYGPQPFAWFMEQALYHPEHGYYSSGRASIGRRGDYFTNVSVGPIFGQLLAAQFAEIWQRLGQIGNFAIVEQGAHHGDFARDVLARVRERFPKFFAALRYRIVEPFPVLQDRQSATLADFRDKVQWTRSLTPFTGVHFSNELLDALPVNLPGKRVGLANDEFVFIDVPDDPATKANQWALDWIDVVAANLRRGFVIMIDYGHARSRFHHSLQVRAQHRHLDSPFEQIGRADISMHVNWTDLAERAEADGLYIAGFTDQHRFLTGILSTYPELLPSDSSDLTALSSQVSRAGEREIARELQTLLHPEMLGRAFQVVALSRDMGGSQQLCGFKFARDPRAALELTQHC